MAKKMRTINNPLDRQTRNDINYNFGVLDEALSDMATTGTEANERFTRIENDVVKLKNEDKNLSDRIDANEQAIEAMDIDAIKLQGEIAEQQGIEAKKKGDKAEQQGNLSEQKGNVAEEQGVTAETKGIKAEQQGNYAKEMGDYAKEKAEYAAEKTSEIEQAHTDLSQIKVEAVDATQSANTQAEYAKEQGDYAKLVGDEVADKLSDIESVKQDVISKGKTTQAQGLKAEQQGDYAQSVIDSYKHVGDWEGSVEYKKNQEVLYNGSTYRAIEDNKGTQPTDKSKWQLIAQRGVDGEGAVASVNGIMPDSDGNVNLGDIASKEYVDDKIGDVDFSSLETKTDATAKLEEAKQYTDTKISEIPEVDLSKLETKTDATAKLTEAKQYTDEKIGDVDFSALETKEDATAKLEEAKGYTDEHTNSKDNPHNVTKAQVGLSNVPNFGIASKAEAEHGSSSTLMTPLRTLELIDFKTSEHINSKENPHEVTKAQVGLSKVNNVEQMPRSGAEFSGMAKARNNTSYTAPQLRNIVLSPQEPESEYWGNGDIWVVYKE